MVGNRANKYPDIYNKYFECFSELKSYLQLFCEGYLYLNCKEDSEALNIINPITGEIMIENAIFQPLGSFMYLGNAVKLLSKISNMDNDIKENFFRQIPILSIESDYDYYIHTGYIVKEKFLTHFPESTTFWTSFYYNILYNPITGKLSKMNINSSTRHEILEKSILTGLMYQKRWNDGKYHLAPMIESMIDTYAQDDKSFEILKYIPSEDIYNFNVYCVDINQFRESNEVEIHWAIDTEYCYPFRKPIKESSYLLNDEIEWKRGAIIEYIYFKDEEEQEKLHPPFECKPVNDKPSR